MHWPISLHPTARTRSSDVDQDRVAALEFGFIDLFRHGRRSGPKALHRKLAAAPAFFVELVSNAFRAKGEATKAVSPEKTRLAERSYHLLRSWRQLPGRRTDGSIDEAKLLAWITAAREACREAKRAEVGDSLIGELLAHAPNGADGLWPIEAVRRIIESVRSEKMRNGIRVGLFNKENGGFRARPAGGAGERKRAAEHKGVADKLRQKWPLTASIHEAMAASYEHDAARADREAEEEA